MFLINRVELKVFQPCEKLEDDQRFLINRVELKGL